MIPHVAARLAEVDRQQQAAASIMDHIEDQLSHRAVTVKLHMP
jgi:hypothetical protein